MYAKDNQRIEYVKEDAGNNLYLLIVSQSSADLFFWKHFRYGV